MAWAIGIALLLIAMAWFNTFRPMFNRVFIRVQECQGPGSLPFAPLRILHLSDLHMEHLSIPAERIVDELKGEMIDLVAITGDLLDRARNIPKALAYVRTLQELEPTLGIFVVFGNHDYVLKPGDLARLKAGLEAAGCRVLCNESVTVDWHGTPLHIIGVDDHFTRRSRLDEAFAGVPAEGVRLVLTHDPNVVLEMDRFAFDYLLSGHFHGGQILWPKPFHLAKMGRLPRMNMVKGLHQYRGRPFYISEGLGQTGVNIRVRSRPEITLHTLSGEEPPVASAPAAVKREAAVTTEVSV